MLGMKERVHKPAKFSLHRADRIFDAENDTIKFSTCESNYRYRSESGLHAGHEGKGS